MSEINVVQAIEDSLQIKFLSPDKQNQILARLMRIEPPKIFAYPDDSIEDAEVKLHTTLSNLADRELVALINWSKQIPGTNLV
jgi:hypothetical protein